MGFDAACDLYLNNNGQLYELKNNQLQLCTTFNSIIKDSFPAQYHYDKLEDKWLVIQANKLFSIKNKTLSDTFLFDSPFSENDKIEFLDFSGHTFITHTYDEVKEYYVFHDNQLELLADIRQGIPRINKAFHHPYLITGGGRIFRYNNELNKTIELYQDPASFSQSDYLISYKRDFFFAGNDAFYQFLGEAFKNYDDIENTWMLALGQKDTVFAGGYFPSRLYKIKDDFIQEIALDSIFEEIAKRLNKINNRLFFYPGGSLLDNTGYFPFSEGVIEYKSGVLHTVFSEPSGPAKVTHADRVRKVVVCGVANGIMIIKDGKVIETVGQKNGIHPNKSIISIAQDKKNRYWLGSHNGLTCYDPDRKMVHYNFTSDSHPKQIKGGVVSMTQDNQGRLWFGTPNGLCILDEQSDSLVEVTKDDKPIYCSSITHTDDDYLLIGNPEGLYQFDCKNYFKTGTIRYRIYNQTSGFLGEDIVNSVQRIVPEIFG